jgi:hypothetical protein
VQKRVCYIHVGPHKTGTTEIVHDILLDRTLAVEAPWNDVRQRSGLVFKE